MKIKYLLTSALITFSAVQAGSFFNKDKTESASEYVQDKADYFGDMTAAQWYKAKGSVKMAYGKLTDDDLTYIEGKKDKFLGVMRSKYGYTKDRANDAWRKLKEEFND